MIQLNFSSHSKECHLNCLSTFNSGIKCIHLDKNSAAFDAPCNHSLLGGGWTGILSREQFDTNFHNRDWTELLQGFGDLRGDFFLGLEKLYALTTTRKHKALFVLQYFNETTTRTALYSELSVNYNNGDYSLILSTSGYSGDAILCEDINKYNEKEMGFVM